MAVCNNKIKLSNKIKKRILVNFNGGNISSDAGLIFLKQIDKCLELTQKITDAIYDTRDQTKIEHSLHDLIRQRIYQILLGYQDCNDANTLRNDPIFKTAIDKLPDSDNPLAAQSTLTRLENMVGISDIHSLTSLMVETYISRKRKSGVPKEIIIDIDPTDDPCHGKQENALFHGYYWQTQYFPLLVFDGETGDIIAAMLRPGTVHASQGADSLLKRIVKRIRQSFPDVKIKIRGDAGFGLPKMYDFCEENNLKYIFGLASNNVLKNQTKEIQAKQKLDFESNKKESKDYITFKYKADSWNKERTVIAKIEYNEHGSNVRFIVTNIDFETPEIGYKYYTERGECENFIKDLKNHLYLDRLSCCSYIANYFRMLLSCFGYVIMQELRLILCGTIFEKMEINTIRLKLFKIGARVIESTRRVWINLSSYFAYKDIFLRLVT